MQSAGSLCSVQGDLAPSQSHKGRALLYRGEAQGVGFEAFSQISLQPCEAMEPLSGSKENFREKETILLPSRTQSTAVTDGPPRPGNWLGCSCMARALPSAFLAVSSPSILGFIPVLTKGEAAFHRQHCAFTRTGSCAQPHLATWGWRCEATVLGHSGHALLIRKSHLPAYCTLLVVLSILGRKKEAYTSQFFNSLGIKVFECLVPQS